VFESVFKEFGLPGAIRTDNGVPLASPHALFNLSRLSVWWLRLGIAIERIKPGCPQQNGRHERMHLTLKLETTKPAGANFLQQQQARFCSPRTPSTRPANAKLLLPLIETLARGVASPINVPGVWNANVKTIGPFGQVVSFPERSTSFLRMPERPKQKSLPSASSAPAIAVETISDAICEKVMPLPPKPWTAWTPGAPATPRCKEARSRRSKASCPGEIGARVEVRKRSFRLADMWP
jgi:hypothetical protein